MNGRGPPRGRGPRGAPGAEASLAMGRRLLLPMLLTLLYYPGTTTTMTSSTASDAEGSLQLTPARSSEYSAPDPTDQYTSPASTARHFAQSATTDSIILMTNPENHETSSRKPSGVDTKASELIDAGIVTQEELTTKGGGPQEYVVDDAYRAYNLRAEAAVHGKSGTYQFVEGQSEMEELSDIVTQSVTDAVKEPGTSRGGLVWGEVGRGLVAASSGDDRGEGRRPALLVPGARARSGPFFEEDSTFANVTSPAGSTVLLDCRVAMLQDKVVTWAARRADRLQLLTVGKQPYSADKRMALSFKYPNNWRLRINNARRNDQGLYECQVAAHPPIIRQIYLSVISPEVSIYDESGRSVVERYYKAGSFLQLTCSAVQLLEPPSMLSWWQANNPLTDGINCNVTGPDSATCTLVVEQVSRSHAGTYTCGTGPAALRSAAALDPTATGGPPPGQQDPTAGAGYSANASVAVHVLHGNLIGVAVLPNTGKSIGAKGGSNISVQELILGITVALLIQSR